jgi:hypothetical protein
MAGGMGGDGYLSVRLLVTASQDGRRADAMQTHQQRVICPIHGDEPDALV